MKRIEDEGESAPTAATPLEVSRNPFAAKGFTRWWLASMVAGTGVGIQSVTVPLYLRDRVDLHDRAIAIAAALVAQTLPAPLLALVGGAIADRVGVSSWSAPTGSPRWFPASMSSSAAMTSGTSGRSFRSLQSSARRLPSPTRRGRACCPSWSPALSSRTV